MTHYGEPLTILSQHGAECECASCRYIARKFVDAIEEWASRIATETGRSRPPTEAA